MSSINQMLRYGRVSLPPVGRVSRLPLPSSLAEIIDAAVALGPQQRPCDATELHARLVDVARAELGGVDHVRHVARFAVG